MEDKNKNISNNKTKRKFSLQIAILVACLAVAGTLSVSAIASSMSETKAEVDSELNTSISSSEDNSEEELYSTVNSTETLEDELEEILSDIEEDLSEDNTDEQIEDNTNTQSEDNSNTQSEDTESEEAEDEQSSLAWSEEALDEQTMYVIENCNIRIEAIEGASIVSSLEKADTVSVIAITDTDYYKLADGQYVHSSFLSEDEVSKWIESDIDEKVYYVTEDCNVRMEAIEGASVVYSLDRGDSVTITATTDTEYYKINEKEYVHSSFLSEEEVGAWEEEAIDKSLYVTEDCNIREEAIVGATVVSTLDKGDKVSVIAITDTEYYKIAEGQYVHESFLSSTEPTTSSSTNVSTSQNGVVSDGSVKSILNSATLNPSTTGVAVLDEAVAGIFASIFSSSDDTYTKVKACYDYLINNTTYQTGVYYPTSAFGDISVEGSTNYVNWAAMSLFNSNQGSCNRYSAAFIVMMRTIGLEASYISGQTTSSAGGYVGHNWVEVYINGVTYVFDPQVEDNIAGGGTIQYLRFCKTYDQVAGKFIK